MIYRFQGQFWDFSCFCKFSSKIANLQIIADLGNLGILATFTENIWTIVFVSVYSAGNQKFTLQRNVTFLESFREVRRVVIQIFGWFFKWDVSYFLAEIRLECQNYRKNTLVRQVRNKAINIQPINLSTHAKKLKLKILTLNLPGSIHLLLINEK